MGESRVGVLGLVHAGDVGIDEHRLRVRVRDCVPGVQRMSGVCSISRPSVGSGENAGLTDKVKELPDGDEARLDPLESGERPLFLLSIATSDSFDRRSTVWVGIRPIELLGRTTSPRGGGRPE